MKKPSRVQVLIIAIVVTTVVAAGLYVPPIIENLAGAGNVRVSAIAIADKTVAYTGENISFSSAGSSGEIANCTWNFSDGNLSSVPNPMHAYELPGWYNVTLILTGRQGMKDSCIITVGVQRTNQTDDCDFARLYDVRPRALQGTGMSFCIGPNIRNPELAVEFDISNGIGSFWIEIELYIFYDEHRARIETLYSETVTLTREDYHFNRTFSPADIPQEAGVNSTDLEAIAWINQGTWSGAAGAMSAYYSIEGLTAESARK